EGDAGDGDDDRQLDQREAPRPTSAATNHDGPRFSNPKLSGRRKSPRGSDRPGTRGVLSDFPKSSDFAGGDAERAQLRRPRNPMRESVSPEVRVMAQAAHTHKRRNIVIDANLQVGLAINML